MKQLLIFFVICVASGVQAEDWFSDRAEETGLDFVHFNGMSGEYYLAEILGGGVALFDYDTDGDLDVYLTQGHMLGKDKTLKDAVVAPRPGQTLNDRLYRNDLVIRADGRRILRFSDVTQAAGIEATGYGMGVAVGDYDNDGWTDLYVTNWGSDQLWHNNGDGSFSNATARAGLGAPGWAVSAAFFDYDRDGDLDLYVGHYVKFSVDKNVLCYAPTSARDYCAPQRYDFLPDRLYRNRGAGTFEDVSAKAGIAREFGPALGVIAADFNGDGWGDIYVANDGEANLLWINQRNGTFKNEALLAGVAVNMEGAAEGSMGVDAGDFDGDGDEDLFMTHLQNETNTLYLNNGQGWFEDRTLSTGLGPPSKAFTSFGTAWFDYDNDGWLDLFIANGDVRVVPILVRAGDKYPLHQTNQLFRNLKNGRFKEVTRLAGEVFELSEVSRGAAFGDVDNDGDTDILVGNNNGPVRLLINNVGNHRHWLGLRLLDKAGHEAVGAKVAVYRKGAKPLWRRVRTDGSYGSANDSRILLGLGKATRVERVRVDWPSGRTEMWSSPPIDQYTTLEEGHGKTMLDTKQ
jgi:hypothetical protein